MKLVVKILSYTVGILTILGIITLTNDGDLDGITFFSSMILIAQCILTLIYVNDTEELFKKNKK